MFAIVCVSPAAAPSTIRRATVDQPHSHLAEAKTRCRKKNSFARKTRISKEHVQAALPLVVDHSTFELAERALPTPAALQDLASATNNHMGMKVSE